MIICMGILCLLALLLIRNGYALHGTQAVDQLGRSVSHGCVRLGDADIETLYNMANVGDEVIIY